MSTRDGFDDLVAARLRETAPREAPAHLMDSLIARVSSTPQRRRGALGWLGSPVVRLAVAATVLAAAVIAGIQFGGLFDRQIGAEPSGEPSPTPGASASVIEPSGTASPSAEASAAPPTGDPRELLLRLYTVCDTGGGLQPVPSFTLTADGTAVWLAFSETPDNDGPPREYLVGRLNSEGLDQMREQIFGDGLLEQSATYRHERRPGSGEPLGHGGCNYTFTAADGSVVVVAANWFGDEEEGTYYMPAPERQALDSLANALADPEAMVGADGWASAATPYEGVEYQLVLQPQRDSPGLAQGVMDESGVPWPFEGQLDQAGEPIVTTRPGVARCLGITRDEAAAIADAIVAGGASTAFGPTQPGSIQLAWAEGNGAVDVAMIPRMPDGYPTCEDLP